MTIFFILYYRRHLAEFQVFFKQKLVGHEKKKIVNFLLPLYWAVGWRWPPLRSSFARFWFPSADVQFLEQALLLFDGFSPGTCCAFHHPDAYKKMGKKCRTMIDHKKIYEINPKKSHLTRILTQITQFYWYKINLTQFDSSFIILIGFDSFWLIQINLTWFDSLFINLTQFDSICLNLSWFGWIGSICLDSTQWLNLTQFNLTWLLLTLFLNSVWLIWLNLTFFMTYLTRFDSFLIYTPIL